MCVWFVCSMVYVYIGCGVDGGVYDVCRCQSMCDVCTYGMCGG